MRSPRISAILWLSTLLGVALCLYQPSDDVIELTASNFQHKVIDSDTLWLVEFYAPWCGHCQSLAPEWKKAATALKGFVKVGAVDMDTHQSVGAPYNVRGFPTIKIFGANKQSPSDFQGGRTASAIVDAALRDLNSVVQSRLSGGGGGSSRSSSGSGGSGKQSGGGGSGSNAVVELTDGNFEDKVLNSEEPWLVEFFAPWCGHCKRLEPEWKNAAGELEGRMKMGALDATVHQVMASRYGVQGFPTIKYFPAGKKSQQDAEEFDGGRTASDIVRWAEGKIEELRPAPELNQISSQKVMDDACQQNSLCVIAFLPNILDCQSECRNKYLSTLRSLGERHKKQKWGWVWTEAMAQEELEKALGIGGFGYPAMAAMNARKWKFATLRGSFGEEGIHEFLRELSFGRGSTAPVTDSKMPKIVSVDPWDGKDGEMFVDEDIDLSDVELDPLPDKIEL